MAVSVAKEDLLHSLAKCEVIYDNGLTVFQGARVFHVTGLSDGSSDAAKTALYRAISAPGLPKIGDQYPGKPGQAGCICTHLYPLPISESDNDAYAVAEYTTPLPSGPTTQATIISIERDVVPASELVNIHPKDFSLLKAPLPYPAKADQQLRLANIPFNYPLHRITITASVRQANLNALLDTAGSVNAQTWQRKPAGWWWYRTYRELTTNQFPIIYLLEFEFLSRGWRNWLEFDIPRNDMLGTRVMPDDKIFAKAINLKYFYGQDSAPGILVAGMFPMVNFRQLGFGS